MTFIETIWSGMTGNANFSFAIFVVAVLQFIGLIVQIILSIIMLRSRKSKSYTVYKKKKIRFSRGLKRKMQSSKFDYTY